MVERAEQIEGWMEPAELAWLRENAARMSSIAEIGCWKGRSTHALLSSCSGPVYAIDTWKGSAADGTDKIAAENDVFAAFLANVGGFENLHVVRAPSLEAAPTVPHVDMVFIDGSHRYQDVLADVWAWRRKAKRLLCGHDFKYPDVTRAVLDVLFDTHTVAVGAGSIWFAIQKGAVN